MADLRHLDRTIPWRSILMGLVAGQRSMMPLATLAISARLGMLPGRNLEASIMGLPFIAAGGLAMAAAEMAGDKIKTAPDRTVFLGLLARTITSSFAGAALAPSKRQQLAGAALSAGAALTSSYVGLSARKWAMRRWGQTATGFVEEAIMFSAGLAIATLKEEKPLLARRRF